MATDLNFIIVYFLDLNFKIPTIWNTSAPVGTSLNDLCSTIIMGDGLVLSIIFF